ncbi:MAG: helix-turn-helix domain-containing protein [Pyrinomonadaceae bacterium]
MSSQSTLVIRTRPKTDETYLGFLIRLAEINSYDTPVWILQAANLDWKMQRLVSRERLIRINEALAELTQVEAEELERLPYQSNPKKYSVKFFDHEIESYLLVFKRQRVCVECLRESNHCRKQWEFSAVTCCPIHKVLLIEKCPACGKAMTWFRRHVSKCRCGFDWRESKVTRLPEAQCRVSLLLYRAFGLPGLPRIRSTKRNPLIDLGLSSLLNALLILAMSQERRWSNRLIFLRKNTVLENHQRLVSAFSVFENWPDNFHRFLDDLSRGKSSTEKKNLRSTFGLVYNKLYRSPSCDDELGKLLRPEFEKYILQLSDQSYLCSPRWFVQRGYSACLSRTSVSRILSLDQTAVDALISSGKLAAVVDKSGVRRQFVVQAESVERLKLQKRRYLSLKAASKVLGVSQVNVLKLVETSLITVAEDASMNDRWRFDANILQQFIKKMHCRTVPLTEGAKRLRDFNGVLDTVIVQLSKINWGIHSFVNDILSGHITPRKIFKGEHGLSALRFARQEVEAYVQEKLSHCADPLLKIDGGVMGQGFKARALYLFARKDLIKTKDELKAGVTYRLITREAIEDFKSKYIGAGILAFGAGTSIEFLVQSLKSQDVTPVSGRSIDGGPQYIFRRSDLAGLNLRRVIAANPILRSDRRPKIYSVGVEQAARILDLNKKTICNLVADGILRPYANDQDGKRGYRFNRTYIERHKEQFPDLTDLLSLRAAAERLEITIKILRERWMKTGYITYVLSKDGNKRFLCKSDVEQIADFMATVVNRSEAAAFLGVSYQNINELVRKGLVRQVANPYPKAISNMLISKSDLDKSRDNAKHARNHERSLSSHRLTSRRQKLILAGLRDRSVKSYR